MITLIYDQDRLDNYLGEINTSDQKMPPKHSLFLIIFRPYATAHLKFSPWKKQMKCEVYCLIERN